MPRNLNVNRPAVLPRRIVLTGFMGAGKSTVGMRLARELGWTFVDLDEEIVRTEQQSIGSIFGDWQVNADFASWNTSRCEQY